MEISFGKPYTDLNEIRTFDVSKDESDFVWHRDKEDRIITVLNGNNWKLQFDNCMPFSMILNEKYKIPKMVYHRLIKGKDNLVIKVEEI